MRTAQVSELKERLDEVIEAVRNGETVEIRDGASAVAEVRPTEQYLKSPADTSPFPDWFFEERPPKFEGGSVLQQLLDDRKESLW
jgi:antitoxin (DNA-binding transcriptional repressor) of toxin-antitoxin stability system